MRKPKTVTQLKRDADAIFSKYIRQSAADPHLGTVPCVTCGVVKPWQEQQCGHYISRGSNALRYDERNCHVQCVGCNVFKKGNYPAYALYMLKTYGSTILEKLAEESRPIYQFKTFELQAIVDKYKALTLQLEGNE